METADDGCSLLSRRECDVFLRGGGRRSRERGKGLRGSIGEGGGRGGGG